MNNLVKASMMVLSDYPSEPVDTIFLFSRSPEDSIAVVELASDLILGGIAKFILLADQDGEKWKRIIKYEANPGKNYYIKQLIKNGVSSDKIILCSHQVKDQIGFNTREESDSFLLMSAKKNYKTAVLVTQPHQILRATLGTLKTNIDKKYNMKFWCATPQSIDWYEKAGGSQGLEVKPRIDHIQDEVERVIKYQQKGDLATFQEFFDFIKNRDQ
ncbi:MAG: hypothetical protein ACD_26C00034G0042 [uncultured bacterium]|nr:MAG: hypothetical protein ACD_26C00034G0042 [uncultured bacterium]